MAEQSAMTGRRVDDAEQHAQGGRLAGAVRPENAVDHAFGDGQADAVDGALVAEILYEVVCFDGWSAYLPFVLSRSKH